MHIFKESSLCQATNITKTNNDRNLSVCWFRWSLPARMCAWDTHLTLKSLTDLAFCVCFFFNLSLWVTCRVFVCLFVLFYIHLQHRKGNQSHQTRSPNPNTFYHLLIWTNIKGSKSHYVRYFTLHPAPAGLSPALAKITCLFFFQSFSLSYL